MSETTESIHSSKLQVASPPGIPEQLSFDRVINNGTCPPCTLRDFMDYLLYIEHAAEHLQFFMWFRGYVKKFEFLPRSDKALSPEWTHQNQKDALDEWKKLQANIQKQIPNTTVNEVLKGTMFSKESSAGVPCAGFDSGNPFATPPTSSHVTIQPFRKEIEHIIQTYIAEESPRELNISSGQRKTLLKALEATTHPSAFSRVISDVESVLRNQLHPNFIRWTICNGNRPRVMFARGLGITLTLAGVSIELLLTLSDVGRGYRALGAIALVIGTATLIAAAKGMCVVLHGMHHRHLRPWELFTDAEADKDPGGGAYSMRESVDSVQSANSYEDAPWVVSYQKRNIVRKIFDREIRVQEPALKQIQDMIFVQSMLIAFAVSLLITAIFVAVPKHGYI
ncbi:hypothetical protein D0Z07_8832 [Hyphodiscus hymeniophilus]|uniref:RGS domain-containing protein n=1 Tax=Hyphodiscus hymeniophilus TaxID=353542 RepID=A0A9P6VCA6_9HELO|nr:hypothetical protein D0Z07_8832 [Hyphodiscus hymeniophilus]